MELNNRKGLVVGLGKSGVATARFLKRHGVKVTVTDMSAEDRLGALVKEIKDLGIPMELGYHDKATFENQDFIVISPGVPHTIRPLQQARDKGIPVMGEIELAGRYITEPIVAITGTNGKTTTTTLLGLMLQDSGLNVFVGGNIGDPLIGYVDHGPRADVVVAEISSFQLDTIATFRPAIAVLLNIAPDHLDRYPDFESYAASKCRLFRNQRPEDIAIVSGSERSLMALCGPLPGRTLYFKNRQEHEEGADIQEERICLWLNGRPPLEISLAITKLLGGHNRENIAAASLAALTAGGNADGIQSALGRFQGLPHRLEAIGSHQGVGYFNDSKATNIDAVMRALECFERPVILIMGGRTKGEDFKVLTEPVRQHVRQLIAMGEARDMIVEALGAVVPTTRVPTMDAAVRQAQALASPGDTVLFSPACASFDAYRNYAERGDHFRTVFNDLAKLN